MKRPLIKSTLIVVLGIALAATGCTVKKTEDVRIKLCKEVTARLLDSMKPITFKEQKSEIRNIGDAAVRLYFTITRNGYENRIVTSACFYEHDTHEPGSIEHVDLLAAYATIPYSMTIQGKEVPKEILQQAVTAEQVEPFYEFAEGLRQHLDTIPERIK